MTKMTMIPISERVKEELRELLELDYEEIKVRGWAREYY